MRTNFPGIKETLASGKIALGCLVAYDAPWLIEILGLSGFDFVVIDIEHEPFDDSQVTNLIRTADAYSLPSIVRMPLSERVIPLLDAGAHGVKVPNLRGKAHGEELVAMTRFYPEGTRTYYTQGRSADYGIDVDELEWMQKENDRLFVMAMIEDIKVVEQLEDILSIDGIDGFHVGPHDLAQSMGYPAPEALDKVITEVVKRCCEAGKYASVGVITPWNLDKIDQWIDDGCQFLILASAWALTNSIVEIHNDIRRRIPRDRQSIGALPKMSRSKYLNPTAR